MSGILDFAEFDQRNFPENLAFDGFYIAALSLC